MTTENVIDLDSRRTGWRANRCICGMCGHRWIGVLHPQANWWGLECPACSTRAGVMWAVGLEEA